MHNIDIEDRLAALSAAIADRTRARMLCLLMDGRAYTATELSAAVEVAPSTASAHLAKLLEQRLIACVKQGRYRYFRLAGQPVAAALEGLMALAGVPRPHLLRPYGGRGGGEAARSAACAELADR